MRFARLLAVLAACAFAFAGASVAATPYEIYAQGHYEAAIEAGEAQASGDGLAVAARAALAIANLKDTPCLECLQRAERLARRSIAADPKRPEAYVYLSASLGYQARIVGLVQARLSDYPGQTKTALDTALRLAPNDPFVLAAMGGWNIEIVRSGGRFLADMLYGARFDTGVAFFRKALAADPANPAVPHQFAISLSGFDPEVHRKDIEAMLKLSLAIAPRTAYERAIRARAETLLRLLNGRSLDAFHETVKKYQGYP